MLQITSPQLAATFYSESKICITTDNGSTATLVVSDKNRSIPAAVEDSKVDVMMTDNVEAMLVAGKNIKLFAVSPEKYFTKNDFGYMLPRDDFAFSNWMNLWMHQMQVKEASAQLKAQWIAK